MENIEIVTLVVAGSSLLFTLYQWVITARLKRPNLRLIFFELGKIFVNHDCNSFRISVKEMMLSNLSDLPNSIVRVKIFCRNNRKWQEGQMVWRQESERMETRERTVPKSGGGFDRVVHNEIVKRIEEVNPYPIVMNPHISNSLSNYQIDCVFPEVPTARDVENLVFQVKFIDQYSNEHSFVYTRKKHFGAARFVSVPDIPHSEILGRLAYQDPEGKVREVMYAKYAPVKDDPEESKIEVHRCTQWEMYRAFTLNAKAFRACVQSDPESPKTEYGLSSESYEYSEGKETKRAHVYPYVHIVAEEGKPKEIELKYKRGDELVFSDKFPVPQHYRDLCAKTEGA